MKILVELIYIIASFFLTGGSIDLDDSRLCRFGIKLTHHNSFIYIVLTEKTFLSDGVKNQGDSTVARLVSTTINNIVVIVFKMACARPSSFSYASDIELMVIYLIDQKLRFTVIKKCSHI